jgi:L-iditol 2-dehydrogenase
LRAFIQTAIGSYEEREVPDPIPQVGEVVVRVRAALTCGTDLKLLDRGHPRIALPVTMGHEACGEIAAVGRGVDRFAVGDRVVPGITGPCGVCRECIRGFQNLCAVAHGDRTWGAFADLLRVPAAVVGGNLHRVPDGLPDEIAAFVDPLASVLHGWTRIGSRPATLLVYGAGALGLLWAATARSRGVKAVVAARAGKARLLAVRKMGAEAIDVGAGAGSGPFPLEPVDAAVDCTGDPGIWRRLADLVLPGGTVLLFGGCAPGATAEWDAARLHYSEISLVGSFHYTPDEARAALAMLASKEIDPTPLLSGRVPLTDLPRALDAQRRREGIRYAVFP